MSALLYKTINLSNGKTYIGVTTDFTGYYLGSGSAIKRAIEKYGRQNFFRMEIKRFKTIDEAYQAEMEIVTDELVRNKNNYNLVLGGRRKDRPKVMKSYNYLKNRPEFSWENI